MRCPVPYALLAFFGWGLADVALARARAWLSGVRGLARRERAPS